MTKLSKLLRAFVAPKPTATQVGLCLLPPEILWHILSFLSEAELLALSKALPELKVLATEYLCRNRQINFNLSSKISYEHKKSGWPNDCVSVMQAHCTLQFSSPLLPQTLEFKDSNSSYGEMSHKHLLPVLKSQSNLRKLGIHAFSHVDTFPIHIDLLHKLSKRLPQLRTLSLYRVLLTEIPSDRFERPLHAFKRKMDQWEVNPKLADKVWFPKVTELKLGYVNRGLIQTVANPKVVPNLEKLYIASKHCYADLSLEAFAKYPQSKVKELIHVPSRNVMKKSKLRDSLMAGVELQKFINSHCAALTVLCLDPVPTGMLDWLLQSAAQMPNLKKLALRQERVEGTQPKLVDGPVLSSEYVRCRNLESIFLDGEFSSVGDQAVQSIIREASWNIRVLKLWNCTTMSERTLVTVAKCSNLTRLELFRAHQLHSKTFKKILLKVGPKMKFLAVERCKRLHWKNSEKRVKNYCPKIEKFVFIDSRVRDCKL